MCLLARYTALGIARTTCKTPLLLSECVSIGPLPSTGYGADNIENTSSNNFSIILCAYFGRCLEIDVHVTVLYQSESFRKFLMVSFLTPTYKVWERS
jgi:hypothetical protein